MGSDGVNVVFGQAGMFDSAAGIVNNQRSA